MRAWCASSRTARARALLRPTSARRAPHRVVGLVAEARPRGARAGPRGAGRPRAPGRGGHPLALELLEIYGQPTHQDWLRFLDEEILTRLPEEEMELLSTLAVATSPVEWETLASSTQWNGPPPENLIQHGLLLELEQGMWLHEALKERLLRDVGERKEERKAKLK